MQKINLGNTGLEISRVVFGGIIVMNETAEDSARYVEYAINKGVNYFDVAPGYENAESMLGPALAPYRKDVYLACKSVERSSEKIKADLDRSLKLLQTDYFDVYQLHALATQEDLDLVFAKGGALEVLLKAKEEGIIRNLGFSAHDEDIAIQAMAYYDFKTALFPVNWALLLQKDFGRRLLSICKYKNMGILAMKSLIERNWRSEEENKRYPKSWCKPIYDEEWAMAALKYALATGADTLVPPGNFENFKFVVERIDELLANPLNDQDLALLQGKLAQVEGELIF